MLKVEVWMDVHSLAKEGHSIKAICRMTGIARNTVRRVLRQRLQAPFRTPRRASRLDPFRDYVKRRFEECQLSSVRLMEEIAPMGYCGSAVTLRRFLATLRSDRSSRGKLTVRFETPPGRQAQADWAYCGRFPDSEGRVLGVYLFVIVLSFSRMLYIEFVNSMTLPWLIRCHQNAFAFFNGWPQQILYDNMKQVRLDQSRFNPLFLDFVQHYGITPKTCQIRRPRTKGKVERMVEYVKGNFLAGRSFASMAELNAQALHWLDHTANVRVHATTGKRPVDLWKQESLTAVHAIAPYQLCQTALRKAGFDGFVRFEKSRYSVPPEYAGKALVVGRSQQKVVIRCEDSIVAEHSAASHPGSTVANEQHLAELWKLSVRRSTTPPLPSWKLTFDQPVATTPLTTYQEVL